MLTPRQQHCLKAMGIGLWNKRSAGSFSNTLTETVEIEPEVTSSVQKPILIPASTHVEPLSKQLHQKNYDLDNWEETQQAIEACHNCELAETCTRKVAGKGNPQADLMIIGEAPGQDEDLQGKPFVGRAGQLLDRILLAIELKTEDVFITNILKCRPPNNRDPKTHEVDACAQFLDAQIKIIQPRIILSVGRISAQTLLRNPSPLGQLRTTQHKLPDSDIPLLVTYHPAYLLRNPAEKIKVWDDMKSLKRQLQILTS